MSDRSTNVNGNLYGQVLSGDNNTIYTSEVNESSVVNESGVVNELTVLFQQMNGRYPSASKNQRQTLLEMELQEMINQEPSLRDRLLSAIQSGGSELLSVISDNPFVSVSIETLKGWLEADSSSGDGRFLP